MNENKAVKTTHPGPAPDDDPQETTTDLDQEPDASDPADASAQGGGEVSPSMELTLRHHQLLGALVVDPDVRAACKAAGVGRTTAHRWLNDPAFRAELVRQRDAVLGEALDSVKTHAARAMAELAGLLQSKDDRLRRLICNDLLGHAMRVREMEDIERRLAALEKAEKHNGRKKGNVNLNHG